MAVRMLVSVLLLWIAGCDWAVFQTRSEELSECPTLARTYFAKPLAQIEDEFLSHDMDTQYTIYICGNQYMHPPALYLAAPFASQGERAATFLERKLVEHPVDDATVRDILQVFVEMRVQRTYDLKSNEPLLNMLGARVRAIDDPELRANVTALLDETRKP